MIKIDRKTLVEFQENWVKKIHVFFYDAGCSGTKVDIETEFEVDDLELVAVFPDLDAEWKPVNNPPLEWEGIEVYIISANKDKFDGAMVTKIREKSDNPHLQGVKDKYIFSNPKIEDRCGCGTSFSFEKKVPKINLEKLRLLKDRFGK